MIARKMRNSEPADIRGILESFALRGFDDAKISGSIGRALHLYESSAKREGEFFRILLMDLGRDIDMGLCAVIERRFLGKVS